MIENVKNAWKERKLGWTANLLGLKMIDWIKSAKNVKNHTLRSQINQLKFSKSQIKQLNFV